MSQMDQFLMALKKALKAKNILYRDIAKALDLSESSVKRILSNKSLSLERLEEICRVAELSLADIIKAANLDEGRRVRMFTVEQEKALAENARLLHFFMMLQEGKTPQKIEKEYEISATEIKKYLFHLDKLNLIELHPRDRVKIREGFIRFNRTGAVGKALFAQTKTNYLSHDFTGSHDFITFSFMSLSQASMLKYKAKFEKLIVEMQEESKFESDQNIPGQDIGVVVAYRPWQYAYMSAIKRK